MTIERDLQIDAPPQVVFDVLTRPEHLWEWWSGEGRAGPVEFAVVETDPPRRYAFRWRGPGSGGRRQLVSFHLVPAAGGTRVRFEVSIWAGQASTMR